MANALLGSVGTGLEAALAAALLILALRAWRRARSPRLALVALAFLLLFAQALVLAAALFTDLLGFEDAAQIAPLLGAVALASLYVGGLRP